MSRPMPTGEVCVSVPATSANLGSGFDMMGIALDLRDRVRVRALEPDAGVRITVRGEGAASVPLDESHLVVRMIRQSLRHHGCAQPGLEFEADNVVPHGRGLGSSAAAIVAGLAIGQRLARPEQPLDLDWLVDRASELEGHPDNATAAVLGGAVMAFSPAGPVPHTIVEHLDVHPDLQVVAFVPAFEVATANARQVLPDAVLRTDAVQQAIRSAFLVRALTTSPERLLLATEDFLHQRYRSQLMEPSWKLVTQLRIARVPAVISGAGPTVLAIGTPDQLSGIDAPECLAAASTFATLRPGFGGGVRVEPGHADG